MGPNLKELPANGASGERRVMDVYVELCGDNAEFVRQRCKDGSAVGDSSWGPSRRSKSYHYASVGARGSAMNMGRARWGHNVHSKNSKTESGRVGDSARGESNCSGSKAV